MCDSVPDTQCFGPTFDADSPSVNSDKSSNVDDIKNNTINAIENTSDISTEQETIADSSEPANASQITVNDVKSSPVNHPKVENKSEVKIRVRDTPNSLSSVQATPNSLSSVQATPNSLSSVQATPNSLSSVQASSYLDTPPSYCPDTPTTCPPDSPACYTPLPPSEPCTIQPVPDTPKHKNGMPCIPKCENKFCKGKYATQEGFCTQAPAFASHSEGCETKATGDCAHAEGAQSVASGFASHAENCESTACGDCSHAEGSMTVALGNNSHAQNQNTRAYGLASHTEGVDTVTGREPNKCPLPEDGFAAHAEGYKTLAYGKASHAENCETKAYGPCSHAEGQQTQTGAVDAKGNLLKWAYDDSFVAGTNSHVENAGNHDIGVNGHTEGLNSINGGAQCHIEGANNEAYGFQDHVRGCCNTTNGKLYNGRIRPLEGQDLSGIGGYFRNGDCDDFGQDAYNYSRQLAGNYDANAMHPGEGISVVEQTLRSGVYPQGRLSTYRYNADGPNTSVLLKGYYMKDGTDIPLGTWVGLSPAQKIDNCNSCRDEHHPCDSNNNNGNSNYPMPDGSQPCWVSPAHDAGRVVGVIVEDTGLVLNAGFFPSSNSDQVAVNGALYPRIKKDVYGVPENETTYKGMVLRHLRLLQVKINPKIKQILDQESNDINLYSKIAKELEGKQQTYFLKLAENKKNMFSTYEIKTQTVKELEDGRKIESHTIESDEPEECRLSSTVIPGDKQVQDKIRATPYVPAEIRTEDQYRYYKVALLGLVVANDNGRCVPGHFCTVENGVAKPGRGPFVVCERVGENQITVLLRGR